MNIPFLYLAMSTSSICFEISSPTVSIRTELLGKYQRPRNHRRGLHSTGTDGQEILPFVAGIICPSRPLCRLNRIPQFVIKVLGPSLDAAVAFATLPGLALAFVLALAFALIAFGRLTSLSFSRLSPPPSNSCAHHAPSSCTVSTGAPRPGWWRSGCR